MNRTVLQATCLIKKKAKADSEKELFLESGSSEKILQTEIQEAVRKESGADCR